MLRIVRKVARRKNEWMDISLPLVNGMAGWPGDPPFHVQRVHSLAAGDHSNLSAISLSAHSGTHIDAPRHFVRRGKSIDRLSFDTVIGPARVIRIKDPVRITPDELARHDVRTGERLLFRTANSGKLYRTRAFSSSYVHMTPEAAEYLVSRGTRLVGVDYLSIGAFGEDGHLTHDILLRGRVWILESLNLSGVEPGLYEFICLPLNIIGSDGAPARAVLRPAPPAVPGEKAQPVRRSSVRQEKVRRELTKDRAGGRHHA